MDARLFLLARAEESWRGAGKPGRVVAAVSGGADSVALLMILRALSRQEGFFLAAAHVDHGMRDQSKADAEYTAGLCREWVIPFRSETVRVEGVSENAARSSRYAALFRLSRAWNADALALAHHQRDQAETVLLHLFRGSGGEGLAGMEEASPRRAADGRTLLLWRPFLDAPPALLRQLLTEQGVSWREDATNARDDYLRNYLRHQVLPTVTARIPRAEEAIGRAAKVLGEEARYFSQAAQTFLDENACLTPPCPWISYPALHDLHPALRRHALRMSCPVPLSFGQTEEALALIPGQTCNLPGGWRALCTARYLHFLPPDPPPPRPGVVLSLPFEGSCGDGIRLQAVPRALFDQCELRFRTPGDVIRPLGGPGVKSLQDYWVDRQIDRPFRPYLPLLCVGARVIWSIGVGCAEEARVRPGDDAVLLKYAGYLPGERTRQAPAPFAGSNEDKGENT